MYGSSTGQLHVLTLPTSKSMPWVVSGEQGPDWIEAKIDLNMTKIFMVSNFCFQFIYLIGALPFSDFY